MSVPMCSHALAAASSAPKSILHLRKALRLVPASSSSPILDFLLPPSASSLFASRRGYATTAPSTSESHLHSRTRQHKSLSNRRQQTSPLSTQSVSPWATLRSSASVPARNFSSTSRRANTQTLLNPQKDDDGNEMRLEITARAAKRLNKVMEKDANNRLALRIQVESGGCHGFQYVMSLVTLPETLPAPAELAETEEGAVIREDDTIFAYAGEEALSAESAADPLALPKIILDTPSLELLNGSKVDFTMELIGSQFKIVDNPAASSSCGCGTSFDIKV